MQIEPVDPTTIRPVELLTSLGLLPVNPQVNFCKQLKVFFFFVSHIIHIYFYFQKSPNIENLLLPQSTKDNEILGQAGKEEGNRKDENEEDNSSIIRLTGKGLNGKIVGIVNIR